MRTTRPLAALAAGALLAATLAGCGGSDDKKADDPKATSTSSAEAGDGATDGTTDGSTDGATDTPTTGSTKVPAEVEDFTDKLIDAMRTKKTAHMVINMGSSVSVDADIEYKTDSAAMDMRITSGATTLNAIIVNGAMYLQQTEGGKYTKIGKNDQAYGSLVGSLSNLGPEASVRAMRGSIRAVEKDGTATIDGEKLTRYKLTVDGAAIADQLGAAGSTVDLPKTVTYLMYVDSDDLLRRTEMTVAGQKLVLKVTNWGKPVDIKAPPASKIAAN